MTTALTKEEIEQAQRTLPEWKFVEGKRIEKEFSFDSFPDAIAFVRKVADIAEAAQHHPDIDIRYTKVGIALSTHDAGGLTQKDIALAQQITQFI